VQLKFNSRALFACVCLLLASPAWAHGSDASPFWGGMLHIVMSPLALAALLGLVAALFGVNEDLCPSAAGVACVSAAGMAVLGASHVSLAASLAPVGVCWWVQQGWRVGGRHVLQRWHWLCSLAALSAWLLNLTTLCGKACWVWRCA
jgi:hypothetical protein